MQNAQKLKCAGFLSSGGENKPRPAVENSPNRRSRSSHQYSPVRNKSFSRRVSVYWCRKSRKAFNVAIVLRCSSVVDKRAKTVTYTYDVRGIIFGCWPTTICMRFSILKWTVFSVYLRQYELLFSFSFYSRPLEKFHLGYCYLFQNIIITNTFINYESKYPISDKNIVVGTYGSNVPLEFGQ